MTPKQEAFCIAYIETGNASEAATSAGYDWMISLFTEDRDWIERELDMVKSR